MASLIALYYFNNFWTCLFFNKRISYLIVRIINTKTHLEGQMHFQTKTHLQGQMHFQV